MKKIFSTAVFLFAYFVVSAVVIVHANGFQIQDCQRGNCEFVQTSGVFLDTDMKISDTLSVTLNGVSLLADRFPQKILWLEPGRHVITVRDEGYHTYVKAFELQPGSMEHVDFHLLPIELMSEEVDTWSFDKKSALYTQYNGYELWKDNDYGDSFVTRLSSPIQSAFPLYEKYIFMLDAQGDIQVFTEDRYNQYTLDIPTVNQFEINRNRMIVETTEGDLLIYQL